MRLGLALLGSVAAACLEIIGVAAVLPLMQLLTGTDPQTGVVGTVSRWLGNPPATELIRYMAVTVLLAFTTKAFFTIWFRWWLSGFLSRQEAETGISLLRRFLAAPYRLHQERSSASFVRSINEGVSQTYSVVVIGLVTLISEAVTVAALMGVLLFADPIIASAALLYFAVAAGVFDRLVRSRATSAGRAFQASSLAMTTTVFESLHSIKEIKVRGASRFFLAKYSRERHRYAKSRRTLTFLTELPRYSLELVFVCGVALLTVISLTRGDSASTLTTLAVFLAAGFRILPSLVRIAASTQQVRGGAAGVHIVMDDLQSPDLNDAGDVQPPGPDAQLNDRLLVDGVDFRYQSSNEAVLRNVRLDVPAGSSLALVGGSGAGKTTLVDLILGLQSPTAGQVLVDGISIHEDVDAWQRSIGYVPQDVYILDDSLRANIVFGPEQEKNDAALDEALDRAQLGDFVANLPAGLDTQVGERGARISGGQRQRIGIARALYRRPRMLVLDEATSALDNETERRVTEVIHALHDEVTVIVVAHRLSTVKGCDAIAFMEDGRVSECGTFDELLKRSDAFRRLVELGSLGSPGSDPLNASVRSP